MDSQVIVLSALRVEYEAVRRYLTDPQEIIHPTGTVYEQGLFLSGNQSWKVTIAEIGQGNVKAAIETVKAIEYFKPKIAFFVGVAGGIKDVSIGDVVVATKVYGYESGKAGDTFLSNPETYNSDFRLVERAKVEARKKDWLNQLKSKLNTENVPKILVGPIAAGEKLITSFNSDEYKFIQSHFRDTLAVEMEGTGFLTAVYNYKKTALIICGISDQISNKEISDRSGSQEKASLHASAFTFEILTKLCPKLELTTTITQ